MIFLHDTILSPYRGWMKGILWSRDETGSRAFYDSYTGDYAGPIYVFGLCLVCAIFRLHLRRYYRDVSGR